MFNIRVKAPPCKPRDMLDEVVRHVERGQGKSLQGPSVADALRGITTPTTKGPTLSPHPLAGPFAPPKRYEEVHY